MQASHRRARSKQGSAAQRKAFALAEGAFALAAAAVASPAAATPNYVFQGTIGIMPLVSNTAGTFTGCGLATFDPATQLYYLTDRSNNGIGVLSAKTSTLVERIGPGLSTGNSTSTDTAGPNGIGITGHPRGGGVRGLRSLGAGQPGPVLRCRVRRRVCSAGAGTGDPDRHGLRAGRVGRLDAAAGPEC